MKTWNISCRMANSFWQRLRGMALASEDKFNSEILCFLNCRSIHTFGMRFALDIAFIDNRNIVLKVCRGVKPNRLVSCGQACFASAVCALERKHIEDVWLETGDKIVIREIP